MIKEEILDTYESADKSSEWSASAWLPSSSTTSATGVEAKAENNDFSDADNSVLGYRSMTITDGRFFKRVPEKCIYNSTVATCVKCEPGYIEIKGTVNSSSNFLCHLKRRHGKEAVEEYTEYLRSKKRPRRHVSDGSTRQARASANAMMSQERLESEVLKFVISTMVPLQTVVSPSFCALLQAFNVPESDLKALNSENLTLKIEQLSEKNSRQISKELRDSEHVFCTANVWKGEERRYLAITTHWIDSDMKRRSAAVRFRKMGRIFQTEKLKYNIDEVVNEFGVQGADITTIIGDYSCNFLKAFNVLGIENKSVDGHDEDDENRNQPEWVYLDNEILLATQPFNELKCSAQMLITCASVDVARAISSCTQLSKMHQRTMKKCSIIWNHLQSDELVSSLIGLTLTRPTANNWTSFYNSLKEILAVKSKCVEVFRSVDMKGLEEAELLYIEEHLACTKPIADSLTILQDTNYTLFGALLPTLLALRRKLGKLLSREWVYCRPIAEENVRIINDRFKDFYNFTSPQSVNAAVASFSHPEFKNLWLSCVESKYHAQLSQAFKDAVAAQLIPIKPEVVTFEVSHHDFFDFGTEDEAAEETQSVAAAVCQVSNFFSHSSKGLDSLNHFAEIKKVFLKYNTQLSSFASLGTMFSYDALNEVLSSDRLDPRTVEKRMLLKANANMLLSD